MARPRHGQRLAELPAALHYRQPRRPVALAVQPLFPGLSAAQLRAVLESGAQAVLLECYGSGTGPSDDAEFLAELRQARERGVLLAAISQCPLGHVDFEVYAAGSALAEAGLVSGAGMTREAALGKLFGLLGAGLNVAEAERLFALDLCGELAD
jgi:L-asparaginase